MVDGDGEDPHQAVVAGPDHLGAARQVERAERDLNLPRARVRGPERKVVFVRLEHATDETSGDALGRHDDQGTG